MDSFGIGPGTGLRQFGRAVDYSGRSTRSELISFWIVAFIFGIAIHVLGTFAFRPDSWAAGAFAEFFADKIAWVDSTWDAVHSFVRPVGGALLSLAVVDAGDPAWQVASFLLNGGAAFLAHAGKAGARTMVNASPEPFSNIAVSTAEDVATGGLLALAIANPIAAALIALILMILSLWLVLSARRALKRLLEPKRRL
jgi:hypothetical protein